MLIFKIQVAEEKSAEMRNMQQELRELREDRAREKDLAARRTRQDEEEIQILRERCERLEAQNGMQVGLIQTLTSTCQLGSLTCCFQ